MSLAKPFNTRPLYQQVADEFIARIVSKTWAPGQSIENEAEIARSLGISLGTVRKAFDILTEHKLLERHQGKGRWWPTSRAARCAAVSPTSSTGRATACRRGVRLEGRAGHGDAGGRRDARRQRSHAGSAVRAPADSPRPLFMIEDVFLRVDASAKTMTQEALEAMATARWTGQDLATHKREKATAEAATASDKRNFKLTGDAAILRLQRIICSYQDRPLELRVGRCHLGNDLVYATS